MYVLQNAMKTGGGCIWSHFSEKTMGYSTGYFSEVGSFFKMVITQKFELGISPNFRKFNKFGVILEPFFRKTMGYSTGYFSEIGLFFKVVIT